MSQVTTPTEPGWLPDPSGRFEWRYWDGGWTNRVANSAPPVADATPPATASATPPATASASATPPASASGTPPAASIFTSDAAPGSTSAPAADGPAPAPVLTARDAVPRVPFGLEPATAPAPADAPSRTRRTPWAVIVGFFRSFADQPESYRSPLARDPLPPDPRGEHMVSTGPGNYGSAMFVVFAAISIVAGAYLPWISGTIGLAHFHRSGFDDGLGAGYSIGALALAISALLSVQMRPFRWLTVVLSFVITGFVVRDVLHSYDAMKDMNQFRSVDANVGWGLWIMIVGAAIGMIASVRLTEREKIG